jgi:hypothetical protein
VRIGVGASPIPLRSGVCEPGGVRVGEGGGKARDGNLDIGLRAREGVEGPDLYMSLEWCGCG